MGAESPLEEATLSGMACDGGTDSVAQAAVLHTVSPAISPVPPTVSSSCGIFKRFLQISKSPVFIMLVSPIVTSLLLKSSAILTSSAILLRGWSYLSNLAYPRLSPVVFTQDGPVQGKLAFSRNGSPYWQYFAIPFAQPPVGSLRYQPPQPVKPWKNVRQGFNYPPACVQFEPVALATTWGQEDCLYLNVFVPQRQGNSGSERRSGQLKPVLIYIHGGAFLEGQSSFYREAYIMDQPVILVTFHYRLGPLGFLNFQYWNDTTGHYPRGNQGLKDQLLALQWVQRNIYKFGGDPRRISLMADSAGAVSLHLHMLSPKSRGLFQRAILISGSAVSPWGYAKYAQKTAFDYGARLGCPTDNPDDLLQCYLTTDPRKLVSLQYVWGDPLHDKDSFAPSLEAPHFNDSFLTATPAELMKSPEGLQNVPLLAGVTSGEGVLRSGRFRAMPELIPILDQHWNTGLSRVLFLDDPLGVESAEKLRQFYLGNQTNFEENPTHFFNGLTQLTSDALFVGPTHRAVVSHARRPNNPTYLFYYDYRPRAMLATYSAYSQVRISDGFVGRWVKLVGGLVMDWVSEFVLGGEGGHKFGVGHAENCFQIWDVSGWTKWLTWLDRQFSEDLIGVLVDFAYGQKSLSFRGVHWPQINMALEKRQDLPYMKLDNSPRPSLIREPFKERMQFWNELRSNYADVL